MATVTDKRKVLSVEGKLKVMQETEKGTTEVLRVMGIWSRKFYDPNGLGNRTEIISAYELNPSRIQRFRTPERSDVDEALLK
jgi:hypothetical protein